jgi:glucose/arabinose dehydrogenase
MNRLLCLAAIVLAIPVSLSGAQTLATQLVVSGLARPVFVTHAPGDFNRIFIVEQRSGSTGRIRVFDLTTNTLLPTPFLSTTVSTASEQGLLGLAFHPDYANNGYFFINYTNSAGTTIVARYQVSSDPNVANPASFLQVLSIPQPFSNHNGGWIGFGPDGYLYISTGDGGSAGDPGNRAQTITNQLLGKMLRIDPNVAGSSPPYFIPGDNPFVGVTGDDEIWAYGLRNAWRCAFDGQTGDLWMADVGQNAIEEINFQPASSTGGENYGWRCYEGNNAFNTTGCPPAGSLVFPIHTYTHAGGACSITGGEIYRGCSMPELSGTYFFADVCSNQVWSLRYNGVNVTDFTNRTAELFAGSNIVSFGLDAYGEMYICNLGGTVRKIVRSGGPVTDCDGDGVEDACQIAAGNPPACGCNLADIAPPFGVLDLADIGAFIAGFTGQDPIADLAAPFGVWDLADIQAFNSAFVTGCP